MPVPPDAVFRLPDPVSFEKAPALPSYLTAEFAPTVRGAVTEGSTVLAAPRAPGGG